MASSSMMRRGGTTSSSAAATAGPRRGTVRPQSALGRSRVRVAAPVRKAAAARRPAESAKSGAASPRVVVARASEPDYPMEQVVTPLNGDPFVGMLETPVTSSPLVASFLSNLPAYRVAVSPLLRGVEIGLAHGFFIVGPFIKLGPLRNTEAAEVAGCLSGAGLMLILTACLAMYGAASFQGDEPVLGKKTLTGRSIISDPAKTPEGWSKFTAGFLFGGISGVAWAYIMTQTLPYYS